MESGNFDLEKEIKIDKAHTIIILLFSVAILIIGIILVPTQWNEGLYSENRVIWWIFNIITQAGSEYFYLVLFTILYLAWNKEFAQDLLFNFTITVHFTTFFKDMFQDPRPLTNIVEGEPLAEGYGFPSGHTTGTVAVFGYSYFFYQTHSEEKYSKVIRIVSTVFLILVPLSRMIIGVHDLDDIVGGYLLSILCLTGYINIKPIIASKPWSWQKRIVIGVSTALLYWFLTAYILGRLYPDKWQTQTQDLAQSAGMLIGLFVVVPLEKHFINYKPQNLLPKQKLYAALIGVIVTLGFYFLASFLMGMLPYQYIFRAVRYTLIVLVIGLALPWIFQKWWQK